MSILNGKINVLQISKDLLFKGAQGVYMDITVIPSPNSEFSDYIILQNLSKEDTAKNKALRLLPNFDKSQIIKAEIIGNLKIYENAVLTEKEKNDLPI